ncbi:MAG: gamma-glutamylcyclotransferase [Silicimonas sp.]|nr:gamma-glutamylcyclotransferase [Silicimonas sp.]NND43163.1 gamma-glutamylcyclotransferase [Silicimonas sp.]NNL34987.1 gamma-glutamylcyclotransferase [Silicimonas sp.]NNL73281.1 gamma-glutamylcyclotransferase [Silicimonas sp.]RZW05307.1 MAG: gamma-glutamylcyclotransferase [Paracoccaceae bacterium]
MSEAPDITSRPLWVFGYGSLIWNPGFPVIEQSLATLHGYSRSFCMSSIHHRGTVEHPGLVLALDPRDDAHCQGVAFRVPDTDANATVTYLRERELISSAYVERVLPITLQNGADVTALVYVVDTGHEQYVANLALEDQARIIASAVGGRGPNTEYLWNTASHLSDLGIADDDLDWLSARVAKLTGS